MESSNLKNTLKSVETPPPGYMSEDGENQDQNGTDSMGKVLNIFIFNV